ncbi:MAG: STAS domain-containing protein, partial [Lachnospiraceae bacterium]|nr:STAS domain-containing protein [Lachnospiraceae bacterium]
MKSDFKDGALTFFLEGRIDSSNVDQIEADLRDEGSIFDNVDIAFDVSKLQYISSAGLRVLLKVKKSIKRPVRIKNVSDEIFDILDVTGFTDIFEVERMMRRISLNGCKKLSSALNGEIFELSDDEMIKVYGKDVPLSLIKKERVSAQTAMIQGVPTLIPYDVVRCEEGYGLIFEKAGATSFSYIISHKKELLPKYAALLGKTLRDIHRIEMPVDKFPDIKDRYREWIAEIDDPEDSRTAVFSNLISTIPDSNTYVHGDINLSSLIIQNNEILLLDMSG